MNSSVNSKLPLVTRVGVYGVALKNSKMLLIEQPLGPYAGKFDFPGGGIEFGESVEEALRREFAEEVAMTFDACFLLDNLTAITYVPKIGDREPFTFYQIGLIYRVEGLRSLKEYGDLQYNWVDLSRLTQEQCSPLLWQFRANVNAVP